MKADAFVDFTMIYLPVMGLLIFASIFIFACIWVFRGNSDQFYKELSKIPFKKDKK